MAVRIQRLQLKLRGHQLICRRLGKNGAWVGHEYPWTIRAKSDVPKGLFFLILGFVRRRVNQCDGKTFPVVKKAVLRALCEAAEACGCEHEFGSEGGDLTWQLSDEPLFAFQIHKDFIDRKRAKRMRRGGAMLRWVIEIGKNGFVKFVPRKAHKSPVQEEDDETHIFRAQGIRNGQRTE